MIRGSSDEHSFAVTCSPSATRQPRMVTCALDCDWCFVAVCWTAARGDCRTSSMFCVIVNAEVCISMPSRIALHCVKYDLTLTRFYDSEHSTSHHLHISRHLLLFCCLDDDAPGVACSIARFVGAFADELWADAAFSTVDRVATNPYLAASIISFLLNTSLSFGSSHMFAHIGLFCLILSPG